MVQPIEHMGTSIYKIGCSKDKSLNRCNTGYRKGTRYIVVMECNDPFTLEGKIKEAFNKKFKLIAGREYFEGDENEMRTEFLKITQNYDIIKNIVHKKQCPIKINNYCIYCNTHCISVADIKKHISTTKHKKLSNNDVEITNYTKSVYKCDECSKIYKSKSGLYKHMKTHYDVSKAVPIKIQKNDEINDSEINFMENLAYDIGSTFGRE